MILVDVLLWVGVILAATVVYALIAGLVALWADRLGIDEPEIPGVLWPFFVPGYLLFIVLRRAYLIGARRV